MKKYISILGLLILTILACSKEEVSLYNTKPLLFISNSEGADTAFISFSHYPGENALRVPFVITLIGDAPETDLEYKIQVIDSATTAIKGDYTLPQPPVFRANRITDTLWIGISKENLEAKSYLLKISLVENENFSVGYYNKLTAQLRYNNIVSKPLWWDDLVEEMYLGTYSKEKYDAFILVTGETTLEDKEPWEKRLLALELKDAIAASLADDDPDNDITEANNKPMIIPCY